MPSDDPRSLHQPARQATALPAVLFRGTTRGFLGNGTTQRLGTTCTTTDPRVATLFATAYGVKGYPIVQVLYAADLPAQVRSGEANWFAGDEREVVLDLPVLEVQGYVRQTLAADVARGLLADLRHVLPTLVQHSDLTRLASELRPKDLPAEDLQAFLEVAREAHLEARGGA